MARSNLSLKTQRRMGFTNEPYQTAHREIVNMGIGLPLIPNAQDARQQWAESALLHRLLQGARTQWQAAVRPAHPLFVAYAVPSITGLRVVVPIGDTPAFAAALAMQKISGASRPPADAIAIWREKNRPPRLTATREAIGQVAVECSWDELCAAVETDAQASVLSGTKLWFNADPILELPRAERAALSSLLRRIGLFSRPDALDWLFVWHEWVLLGRIGMPPRLPDILLTRFTTEGVGLPPEQLRTLSINSPTRRLSLTSELRGSESRSNWSAVQPLPTIQTAPSLETELPADGTPADTPKIPGGEKHASNVRRYDDLAVTIMRLDSDLSITDEYYVMRFPDRLATALRQELRAERGSGAVRAQITALHDAISAVIPNCVVAGSPLGGGNGERDWLYARTPVDSGTMARLVAAWVAQQGTVEQTQSTLSQLKAADFVWDPVRVSRGVPFARLSRLLPMAVAARLADATFSIGGRWLRFVQCPTGYGAELMSWPPEQDDARGPFSVTINISLLSVPFSHEPYANLSFGVRRWLPTPGRLVSGRGYAAFFEAPGHPLSFSSAKIRLTRAPQGGGSDALIPQWDPAMAGVLDKAGWLARLPDPERLTTEPLNLSESGSPAALVLSAGMLPVERVSRQLPVIDRASLMSWAADVLAPQLEPVTPLRRVNRKIYQGLGTSKMSSVSPAELRSAIGPQLTIELHTRSETTEQYVLDRLSERLDVELPRAENFGKTATSVDLGDIKINIRGGGLGGRLADPKHTSHPTISLVEIRERNDPRTGATQDTDEKLEHRRRLAKSGRLTQFVGLTAPLRQPPRPDEDSANRNRVAYAVDDLLAQLGVRPGVLPHPTPGTLAGRPALLAIWLATAGDRGSENDRRVPIAVLADPTGQRIMLRTLGSDWLPLHEAALEIGRGPGPAELKIQVVDIPRFIIESVEHAVETYPDTVLLTHAQNLRAAWEPLGNDHLTVDVLDFGGGKRLPITMLPGLRHVRVRTAEHDETPECYGINDATVGQPAGLWQYLEPRLFGSTTGKPAIAADTSLSTSKLASGWRHGRQARLNPKAPVWNERLVELLVAGLQPDDQAVHWAALAHELRNAAPFHTWPTVLPWPLHLAAQVEQYIRVTRTVNLEAQRDDPQI